MPIDDFPGADLVVDGLSDLQDGRQTSSAALVEMAAPRLRDIGFDIPTTSSEEPAGHRLYALLADEDPNGAYSRYNALVRRMASFASAAEHARQR